MTDVFGHKRNEERLEESVDILNRFTETVWGGLENDEGVFGKIYAEIAETNIIPNKEYLIALTIFSLDTLIKF